MLMITCAKNVQSHTALSLGGGEARQVFFFCRKPPSKQLCNSQKHGFALYHIPLIARESPQARPRVFHILSDVGLV